MAKEDIKISCPIFRKQEEILKSISDKINKAGPVKEKAVFAEELTKETDVLLSCADYDGKSSNCKSCRFIANLRKQTANLIIKAKKLA